MPLDTRIALTGQPLQLESPVAQYSQLMSVVNANTQNQLAQMQMSAAQRAMLEEEGAQNYLADPTNDLTTAAGQRGLLRFGTKGQTILKSLAEQRKLQAEEDKNKYDFEVKKLDRAISELTNLTDLPSAFASIDRQVAAKSITPQQGAELKTRINNAPDFSTWQNQTITGMLDAKERLGAMAEQQYQAFRGRPAPAAPAAVPLPQAMATAPINDTRAALMSVPAERSVNAIQLGDGNVVYRVDGKDVPFAVYADAVKGRNQAQGANAAIAAAPAPMAPASAAAAAPMAPAAAAPAAQPNMANALALKIQGLQDERNQLEPFLKSSSAKLKYEDLGKQIDNLSKGFSISAGGSYIIPNVGTFERPPTASEFEQLLASSNMTDAQKIAARAARIKKETTFAPPMQVVMPVAVEDPSRPGSVIYVDRSEAIGKTPATAIEGLGPKEIQTREAKYPQAITALKGFDAKTFKLERDIDDLIANKDGLNEITGFLAGRTDLSAMSKAGRRALSTFNTITAKGGFSELQDMRNASPTGGALGNVSNTEGQQLIASFGALARTQNADDLRNSLTTIKSDLQGSKQRVKEAFDETYAYRANRGKTAAPAVNVDALLDKYK